MTVEGTRTSWALELAQLREETREEWVTEVDPKVLHWLALLPEWTASLATDCGFPAGKRGIESTLEDAQGAMLCEVARRGDPTGGETVRFWMPSTIRSWLFDRWQRRAGMRLEDDVHDIASRILAAHERERPVSSGILRWAELATAELSERVVTGETLLERVRASLDAGDLSDAGDWLFAAEWLSRPLGAVMEMAADRARRQISLHHLRIQDADYLSRFLRREEQVEELWTVAGSKEQWGVHFVGLSGVGKTMLMRFISSPSEQNPFPRSSRIDFDYLDPRIPLERPARLLQELGEGFATDLDTGRQEFLFRRFLDALRKAESAREAMGPEAFGLAAGTRQFHQAVEAFALFLNALPQPVALVLDTCEELAKLHPPGGQMWSVNATFAILEMLREKTPGLKVVVAGRRWLTATYANETRRPPAPPEIANAPPRPFLRFHETRGFSEEEVRRYLTEVRGLNPGEELRATILRTADKTSVPSAARSDDEEEEVRYSPHDVAFCATLLEENPELGSKAVEDGNFDAYVKERILKRLDDTPELMKVFPAASILGRFDAAVIEPMLGNTPAARRAVLARLIAEDWTHLEGGPEPEAIVLKVDPGLLPRLRDYYSGTHGLRTVEAETRRRLDKHLAERLEQGPLATVEVADASVRLLPAERAVEALERASERVVESGAWSWAEAVSQRLLDLERKPELDPAVRAVVWALYLTGMKHSQAALDMAQLWDGVGTMATAHPDEDRRRLLVVRSSLNSIAAAAATTELDSLSTGLRLDEGRRLLGKPGGRSLASALLAAAEELIDAGEERGRSIPVDAVERALLRLAPQFEDKPALRAHLATLRGRLYVLAGDRAGASRAFAEVEPTEAWGEDEVGTFADWQAPSSLAARAVLELLRFRIWEGERGEEVMGRGEETAYAVSPGADSAQLLSLVLQARLAQGRLTAAKLEQAAAYERRLESYHLTAPAHRTAPPLFVSIAQGWLNLGDAESGLKLLREREQMATSRGTDERSTSAAAKELLVMLRQLRLREGLALSTHLIGIDEEQREEALAAQALFAGVQPTMRPGAEDDHASWRVRDLLEPNPAATLLSRRGPAAQTGSRPRRLHALLDLLESELVRQRWEGRPEESETAAAVRKELVQQAMSDFPDPDLGDPLGREQIRLRVRFDALLDEYLVPDEGLSPLIGRIALEEGELLALRLPDLAVAPLSLASWCFVEAGDHYSAFVAELRLAIAEIHAGRSEAALERRREILKRYERIRHERPFLPTLGPLLDRDTAELIKPNDPWRGWVWRLSFYMRWCEGKEGGSREVATAMQYGPEFALKAAAGYERGARPIGRNVHRQRFAANRPRLYRWAPVVTGLLVLLGLGAVTTPLLLLVAGAAAVSVVAIEKVGPRLPRRVLPLSGFDLSLISLDRLGQGPTIQAYSFVATHARARLLPVRLYLFALRRWRPLEYSIIPTAADATTHAKLPESVRQALRRRLLGGYVPLRLEVGSDLAWVPWERILLSPFTRNPRWSPRRSPDVLRVRPRGFPAPQAPWEGEVAAVCTPRWRQFVETSSTPSPGWLADLSSPVALSKEVTASDAEAAPAAETKERWRGVIALGTAAETKAGWRLRLDEEDLQEALQDPGEPRMQELVGPEILARRFPVVVLVRPPDSAPAADRQSSEGMLGLANEIFLAGAHAVITLPVLTPGVAASAIEILVNELKSWQSLPDEEQLRRCAEEVRSCVFEASHRAGEDKEDEEERLWRADLALDVCVFGPRPKRKRRR